jgi:hypothetical protein
MVWIYMMVIVSVSMIISMSIWMSIEVLCISIMMVVVSCVMWHMDVMVIGMWVIVEICSMWVHIVLLVWKTCILSLVVLYSMVELTLQVVEEVIIGMLNIMDHLGAKVIVTVMVVSIPRVVRVVRIRVVVVMGQVVVIVVVLSKVVCWVVSVVAWVVVGSSHEDLWMVHIGDPVIWMVLNSEGAVVVRCVGWVVLLLIHVAVVGSMMSVYAPVDIVVHAMLFSGEVSVVSEMRLMSLQVPETLVEVAEVVSIFSNDWGGMVWTLEGVVLIWSHIVMGDIPSSMQGVISIIMVVDNWMMIQVMMVVMQV